jgi:hypothetical protein
VKRVAKVLQEPLLHFILAGAAIFGCYALVRRPAPADPANRAIRITEGDIEQLRRGWFSQWQRLPSPAELQDLVANRVREEVLSREALRFGLDRDDLIVRRRLAQKCEFLFHDLAPIKDPSDADLTAYLRAHARRYGSPTLLNFSQIYFSLDRGRADPEEDARRALESLLSGADPSMLGDPSLLETEVRDRSEEQVSRQFGGAFAVAVAKTGPGTWAGPLRSAYGWHLVKSGPRTPGQTPGLADVRGAVSRDWADDQRRAANEELLRRLRSRYDISIETVSPSPEARR